MSNNWKYCVFHQCIKQLVDTITMERQILDPIHLPCPNMAGCENIDPQKTANSRIMIANLRVMLAKKTTPKPCSYIPVRFRMASSNDGNL